MPKTAQATIKNLAQKSYNKLFLKAAYSEQKAIKEFLLKYNCSSEDIYNNLIPDVKTDKNMTFYEAVRGSTEIDGFRWIEDMVEQNDNNFDGVINNLPEEKPVAQITAADVIEEEQEKKSIIKKLQEVAFDVEKPKPISPCCLCGGMERF